MFVMRVLTPAKLTDGAATFKQKARGGIQVWLLWQWVTGGDGISLAGQEAEKMSNIISHPAL